MLNGFKYWLFLFLVVDQYLIYGLYDKSLEIGTDESILEPDLQFSRSSQDRMTFTDTIHNT